MTDRELLTLVAKAAGINTIIWTESPRSKGQTAGCIWNGVGHGDTAELWNPLTDDGDALRLAVRLHISIDHNKPACQQRYVVAERCGCEMMYEPVCAVEDVDDETDRDAATRRAIVRAAAEMAK